MGAVGRELNLGMALPLLAMLLAWPRGALQSSLPADVAASVVIALSRHLHADCVQLLGDAFDDGGNASLAEELWWQRVQKLVAVFLPVAARPLDASSAGAGGPSCARERRPLYVLSSGDVAQRFLDAAEQAEWFRLRRWLLLPPPDSARAPVSDGAAARSRAPPLDSEVLLAWRDVASGGVALLEAFSPAPGVPALLQSYASWDAAAGLRVVAQPCVHRRRADLRGVAIRAAALNMTPTSQVWRHAKGIIYGGYVGNLWNVLEQHLRFRTEYYIVPPDTGTGTEDNGVWNGVVGMIDRGRIDVALELYSMTAKRVAVVNFSSPVYYDRFHMFVKHLDCRQVGWKGLVAPFHRRLWTHLLALGVLTYTCACLARALCPRRGVDEAAVRLALLMCNQGGQGVQRLVSWRMTLIFAYAFWVVLMAAYSGRLIASITVRDYKPPFESMEGLLATNYRLAVKKDSAEYNILQRAESGPLKRAYDSRVSHDTDQHPVTDLEGLRRVCADEGGPHAFVTATHLARYAAAEINCSVYQVPEAFMQGDGHLMFAPGRPYFSTLNYYLRLMRNTGVMQKLFADALRAPSGPGVDEAAASPSAVDLESVAAVFSCLAAGAAGAAALLGGELALARARRPRATQL